MFEKMQCSVCIALEPFASDDPRLRCRSVNVDCDTPETVVSGSSNWIVVAESACAYEEGIREAAEKAPLLQCFSSMVTDAAHVEDLRLTSDGRPLFEVFPDDEHDGAAWICVLNPKHHFHQLPTIERASWVAWWIHPAFLRPHKSWQQFRDKCIAKAPRGPPAHAERLKISASTLRKPGDNYLHTVRDLSKGCNDPTLTSLDARMRAWLKRFFSAECEGLEATIHYPCGPIFTTLHVHFRVGISEEHEAGTRRILRVGSEERPRFPAASDAVSFAESTFSAKSYRIEDSSGSYRLLCAASAAPRALFNGFLLLVGSMCVAEKLQLRTALNMHHEQHVVCICGDSGAGKDTVLDAVEASSSPDICFPTIFLSGARDDAYFATRRRYARRPANLEHVVEFEHFAFRRKGPISVINVSRAALAPLRRALPSHVALVVVFLKVSEDLCAERIQSRGRDADVSRRIQSNAATWQPIPFESSQHVFVVDNSLDDQARHAAKSVHMILDLIKG